jgi:hypothetical protein
MQQMHKKIHYWANEKYSSIGLDTKNVAAMFQKKKRRRHDVVLLKFHLEAGPCALARQVPQGPPSPGPSHLYKLVLHFGSFFAQWYSKFIL